MGRRLPSIQSLVCFETAARLGSFTRAAEELNLSQGAISRQISALEDWVGGALFDRTRRRIRLSRIGQGLRDSVPPMLDELETALDRARRGAGPRETVAIASYPTFSARWLLPRVLAFMETAPEIHVEIENIQANAHADLNVFDMAVLQGDPPWEGLHATPLFREDLVVAAAPALATDLLSGAVSWRDASLLTVSTRRWSFRIWSDTLDDPPETPRVGRDFERFDMMIEAAIAGHGVGVFPTILVERELRLGLLKPADPRIPRTRSGYYLVSTRAPEANTTIRRLWDWLTTGVEG